MSQHPYSNALADLPLGEIRYLTVTGSTNQDASHWASEGAPHLAMVIADEQTAGRGRLSRRWLTPPGAALAFSLVLRPSNIADLRAKVGRISGLGGLAVCQALQENLNLYAQLKWPNDVLVNGRKVCGVLAEATWLGDDLLAVILGIGVNVTKASVPSPSELSFPATCLEEELDHPVQRPELLRAILCCILTWIPRLENPAFLQAWEERLAWHGEWVQVSSPSEMIQGRLLGLDPEGALRLVESDGVERLVLAGDVSLRLQK